MANSNIYCVGQPATPPKVNGITFVCIDAFRRIWMGTGLNTTADPMAAAAGSPFLSEPALSRFAMDAGAVAAQTATYNTTASAAATAAATLSAAMSVLNLAKYALALDPLNAGKITAVATAQTAYNTALATAVAATITESNAHATLLDITAISVTPRAGQVNPYTTPLK